MPAKTQRIILSRGSVDNTGAKIYRVKANVPDNMVVALQDDLRSAGFSQGSSDGMFGNRTVDALKSFQEAASEGSWQRDGTPNTVAPSFTGQATGEFDDATSMELVRWKSNGFSATPAVPPPWIAPKEPAMVNDVPFAPPMDAARFWPIRAQDRGGREVAFKGVSGHWYGGPGTSAHCDRFIK